MPAACSFQVTPEYGISVSALRAMSKEFLPSWRNHSPSVLTTLETVSGPRFWPSLLKFTILIWPGVPWMAVLDSRPGDLRSASTASEAVAMAPPARKARRVVLLERTSRVRSEWKMAWALILRPRLSDEILQRKLRVLFPRFEFSDIEFQSRAVSPLETTMRDFRCPQAEARPPVYSVVERRARVCPS